MEKIDFSLAPPGATHEYAGVWRKNVNGIWHYFDDDFGVWELCGSTDSDDYTPIPERELIINDLADNNELIGVNSIIRDGIDFAFSSDEIIQIRAKRIKAGFIKESNNTDTVEIDDDLTWLARNCEKWPKLHYGDFTDVDYIRKTGNSFFPGVASTPLQADCYTREQWMKRRIELGLESEQGKPTKEWDGTGLPPVGWHGEFTWGGKYTWHERVVLPCNKVAYNKNTEWLIWFSSKADEAEFRPLRTSEQIAAEKKKEWVEKASQHFQSKCMPDYSGQPFLDGMSAIYDALILGELKAPEVEK